MITASETIPEDQCWRCGRIREKDAPFMLCLKCESDENEYLMNKINDPNEERPDRFWTTPFFGDIKNEY
jgi:hypothetical protein